MQRSGLRVRYVVCFPLFDIEFDNVESTGCMNLLYKQKHAAKTLNAFFVFLKLFLIIEELSKYKHIVYLWIY